jgi:hypothetical protein
MGTRGTRLARIALPAVAAATLLAAPAHGRPPDVEDVGSAASVVELQSEVAGQRRDEISVTAATWSAPAPEARAPGDDGVDWGALPIGFSAPAALGLAALATVALRARHRRVALP